MTTFFQQSQRLMAAQYHREKRHVRGGKPPMNVLVSSTGAVMFPNSQEVEIATSNSGQSEICLNAYCRSQNPKIFSQRLIRVHKLAPNSVRACEAAKLLLPDHQELVPRLAASDLRFSLNNARVFQMQRAAVKRAIPFDKPGIDVRFMVSSGY